MSWRICLGPVDHWILGEGDRTWVPGRLYEAECGAQAYIIGFGGHVDRRCGRCAAQIEGSAKLKAAHEGVVHY